MITCYAQNDKQLSIHHIHGIFIPKLTTYFLSSRLKVQTQDKK